MHFFLRKIRKHVVHKWPRIFFVSFFLLGVVVYGMIGFRFLEGKTWMQSFYWVFTTMSTVGYGDLSPTTHLGQIHAVSVMILGIGLFGLIVEGVVSTIMEIGEKRKRGLINVDDEDHVLICGWSESMRETVKSFESSEKRVYVLGENLDVRDQLENMEVRNTQFVKGDPTRSEDLKRASADRASLIIIDLETDSDSLDSLITMRNETEAKIVVEVERYENKEKILNAGADEVTIPFVLSGRLIGESFDNRYLTQFVTEIISSHVGLSLEEIQVSDDHPLCGKSFEELLKGDPVQGIQVIGIGRENEIFVDPGDSRTIRVGDRIIGLKDN